MHERKEDNNTNLITQSLPIPEYKMGWIIGKKGTYINQLSKKSGASIAISDSKSKEYGTVWKYVQISGTGRAVDRAKKLLHIRLERLEPRNNADGEEIENGATGPNDGLGAVGEIEGIGTGPAASYGTDTRVGLSDGQNTEGK